MTARASPAEGIWTPSSEDAADNGLIAYGGLYVAGIGAPNDDGPYPERFVVLGHQRWVDIIEAAAAYMDRVHSWRSLHLYPGDDPSVLIPRIPRAVHTHGVFLRHPPGDGDDHDRLDQVGMEGRRPAWRRIWPTAPDNPDHHLSRAWMQAYGHDLLAVSHHPTA